MCRVAHGMDVMDIVNWVSPSFSYRPRIPSMECHNSVLFQQDYFVIVCGWGNMMRNNLLLFDLRETPVLSALPCVTSNLPEFRYGFSLNEHQGKLYVLGGFRGGGYSNSTSSFYSIDLSISEDQAVASYSVVDSSTDMIERGFHTANIVDINSKPTLLVWGGLHHNVAIGALELFDFDSKTWRRGTEDHHLSYSEHLISLGEVNGQEPSPRSGHSCSLIRDKYGNSHLFMVGGSNGGDLLRDGMDLNQIHVLSILPAIEKTKDVMVWTELVLPFVKSSRGRSRRIPGRNHT